LKHHAAIKADPTVKTLAALDDSESSETSSIKSENEQAPDEIKELKK
jgi:hypothetical protein